MGLTDGTAGQVLRRAAGRDHSCTFADPSTTFAAAVAERDVWGGVAPLGAPNRLLWRRYGAISPRMPSIQVKDVPLEVHAVLRRRAAAAGQSLQEYLLGRLVEDASTPTIDEVLDRAGGRAGGHAGLVAAVEAVRAERDAS